MNAAARKEEELRTQRAAEREGRRTRRRRGKNSYYDQFRGFFSNNFHFISDRERADIRNTHLDGMSSDDEVPDHELTVYKNQLSKFIEIFKNGSNAFLIFFVFLPDITEQINAEATPIFEDATEDFSDLGTILKHFEEWRNRDLNSYKDTYFSLCLPKVSNECFAKRPKNQNYFQIFRLFTISCFYCSKLSRLPGQ